MFSAGKAPAIVTAAGYSDRPFRRGYTAPLSERRAIAAAHATRTWLSATLAAADQAVIIAVVIAGACPALWAGWEAGVAVAGAGALLLGRQFRALENLTHEASHYNWSRRNRRLNDLLATWLAGVPTGARLDAYRASHLRHHGRFGTRDDPDLANYRQLRIEELDRGSVLAFALDALGRMPAYRRRWQENARGPGSLPVRPVAWAAILVVLPAGLVWWQWSAALAAALIWLAGYGLMLPVVRFLGESNEHTYTGPQTVFDSTISNIGLLQRFLIHPHGDGYHTVHHLWPGVPHHQVRNLHRRLLASDPDGYARRLRYRTRLLSAPVQGPRPAGGFGR
jgi:fatty acid desaturase